MKKIFALLIALAAVFVAGCGGAAEKTDAPAQAQAAPAVDKNSKILVAYYSRAGDNFEVGVIEKGNTAIVAEMIAEKTGANLFEIQPVKSYPAELSRKKMNTPAPKSPRWLIISTNTT